MGRHERAGRGRIRLCCRAAGARAAAKGPGPVGRMASRWIGGVCRVLVRMGDIEFIGPNPWLWNSHGILFFRNSDFLLSNGTIYPKEESTLNPEHIPVRYRFRGLIRDTGKPVEGHVDADNEEFAFHLLANNGIVTESLRSDPRPEDIRPPSAAAKPNLLPPLAQAMMIKRPGQGMPAATMAIDSPESYMPPMGPASIMPPMGPSASIMPPMGPGSAIQPYQPPAPDNSPMPGAPEVQGAIDSALNSSSSQIEFDALTQHFRGKKVWVIDRDKIKRNVASVVDQAISKSLENAEDAADTRKSVAEAIEKLFKDNRNITSPQGSGAGAGGKNLDAQIDRLSTVIKNFENSLASMQMAIRNMGAGGGS